MNKTEKPLNFTQNLDLKFMNELTKMIKERIIHYYVWNSKYKKLNRQHGLMPYLVRRMSFGRLTALSNEFSLNC